jgi:nucleoid-associated protein YgaU
MGKEATIGLAVILVLLIAFGVVLVRRLSGSTDPSAASSMEQSDGGPSEAAGNASVGNAKAEPPAARPDKLRALDAKSASSRAPRLSPVTVSQFAVVSDGDAETKGSHGDARQLPPPSMMPNPPAPTWADHHDRYGGSQLQTEASQVRQLRPVSMAVSPEGGQPYDPLPSQPEQTAASDTAQVGQMPGRLRSLGPPQRSLRPSDTSGYDYRDSGVYSADAAASMQPPAWKQTSPYSYPTPPQQAQTLPFPKNESSLVPPYGPQDLRTADGDYEVQPNDNYWVISQKLYGSGAYFKALAEHNRSRVPREDRLDVGEVLSAPSILELEKAYPDLCPKPSRRETVRRRASLVSTRSAYTGGRIYVVEEGDTLFDIARHLLGKASRWVEIYQLNRDLVGDDPGYISAGMQLLVPDDQPSERVTQRRRSIYQP